MCRCRRKGKQGPRRRCLNERLSDHPPQPTIPNARTLKEVWRTAAANGDRSASNMLSVRVDAPVSKSRLAPVRTQAYKVNSPLWTERLKRQITNWIPHCIAELSKPDLKGEVGGHGRPLPPRFPRLLRLYLLLSEGSFCLSLAVGRSSCLSLHVSLEPHCVSSWL